MSALCADMPKAFLTAMRSSRGRDGRADEDAVNIGRIMIDEAEEHLQKIEAAALERFARPATPPARRRFRPWRRKSVTAVGPSST